MPTKKLTHRENQTPPQTPVRAAVSINQTKLLEITHRLTERVKELNCHFGISHLFEDEKLTIDDILQGVINIMPPAWQYPQITCVRIKCRRGEFKTANFQETPWRQAQNIILDGKLFGTIEVYYLESRPDMDEGPFLKEERNLIYIIAERLGHMIDRQIAARNVKFLYQRERELRKKLQSEMRVRVDFTRKLIHELKTPLTALIATSQLLYDEIENEKLGKLAGYIMDSANNLNVRIEELHDVVRGETGILKINPQQISLAALLNSLLEETRALCRQSGMQIDLHIDQDLPEVSADPDRIRQVVLNLINNALKYARSGQRIRIAATRQPDAVQVEVQDFGPGIARERQSTIFEPGYQQSQAEERSGGLGIGLALCKMLVERHGGRIRVKSQPGEGASFFFTIPLTDALKSSSAV